MDQPPDRPAALHRRRQVLDVVLARPQPSLPHLRPTGPITQSRRPPDRDRPRPHLHLLGMTLTNPLAAPLRATLRWGHLPSPPRGQFGLTLPPGYPYSAGTNQVPNALPADVAPYAHPFDLDDQRSQAVGGRVARRVASVTDSDESLRYAAGTLMTRNAPARTCIMTATQKYRTSAPRAAIPGGFARSRSVAAWPP